MTDTEAIKAVRRGERVRGEHSLHDSEKPNAQCDHRWRTLFCDHDHDVIECSRCGRQTVSKCDFDEEYA